MACLKILIQTQYIVEGVFRTIRSLFPYLRSFTTNLGDNIRETPVW